MDHEARLSEAIKEALRGGRKSRLSALRMMLAELQRQQKEQKSREPVSEEDGWKVFQRMIRQREEAAEKFREGGRPERAAAEEKEIGVIREFLPAPADESELESRIEAALRESGAASMRDMSRVMAVLSGQLQGRADMKELSARVRKRLQNLQG